MNIIYNIFSQLIDWNPQIALPIKWLFATSFNVFIYISAVIGIPFIFKIMNGKIRNRMGSAKLITGDNT
jgi:hypothetical protein